jgi:hypothetical protein
MIFGTGSREHSDSLREEETVKSKKIISPSKVYIKKKTFLVPE